MDRFDTYATKRDVEKPPTIDQATIAAFQGAYGFKQQRCVSDVICLLRESAHKAIVWGLRFYLACQDVRTAFDSMDHDMTLEARQQRGLCSQLLAVMTREKAVGKEA